MPVPSCSSADVAEILPVRVGSAGGDFDDTTTPSQGEVVDLIDKVVTEVVAVVGPTIDASLVTYATLVVATGVAARIERSFSDDLAGEGSKYVQLMSEYIGSPNASGRPGGMLGRLADAQAKIIEGGGVGVGEEPFATFPLPGGRGLAVGSITRWTDRY